MLTPEFYPHLSGLNVNWVVIEHYQTFKINKKNIVQLYNKKYAH